MSLKNILEISLEDIPKKKNYLEISNLDDKLKAYFLLSLLNSTNYYETPLIIFTSENSKLNLLFNTLTYWNSFLSKTLKIELIPIYKYDSCSKDLDLDNINFPKSKIIADLFSRKKGIYLFPLESITENTLSVGSYNKNILKINRNQSIGINDLFNNLIKLDYKSEDDTLIPGYIRKRGDIINIFPINCKHPLQIDLFGNKIENLKIFNLKSKKTISDKISELVI